jgi:hypothetical protein
MSDDSTWPKTVTDFEEFLKSSGLRCDRREEGASFNNKLLQYSGPVVSVRAVSDRGVWFIEVAGSHPQACEWYDAAILRDLLLGPGEDVLPLQEQVDFIEKHWPDVCSRFNPEETKYTSARLALLRQERAKRRFPGFFRSPAVIH